MHAFLLVYLCFSMLIILSILASTNILAQQYSRCNFCKTYFLRIILEKFIHICVCLSASLPLFFNVNYLKYFGKH
ncbi:hypothetical protein OIU79_026280 [Salix purpurea]|uniref:Uncharacterized protein n=1 Tax=Salix purpurea TaxID=77065 RepID=A0A9Q0VTG7_SALPP|nr:hypothetical protein OIU79_026280 [Salix purpurea]